MITEAFDLPILDWIAQHMRSSLLDHVMPAVTHLGDAGAIWIFCAAALLLIPKYRKTGFHMALALLLSLLVCNLMFKPLVGRMRPFDYQLLHFGKEISLLISPPTDYSFPSGHTSASFAAATALFLHHKKPGFAAIVLSGLIAFSRLYLYVHYPTDVLASVILGTSLALAAHYLVNKGHALYTKKKTKEK